MDEIIEDFTLELLFNHHISRHFNEENELPIEKIAEIIANTVYGIYSYDINIFNLLKERGYDFNDKLENGKYFIEEFILDFLSNSHGYEMDLDLGNDVSEKIINTIIDNPRSLYLDWKKLHLHPSEEFINKNRQELEKLGFFRNNFETVYSRSSKRNSQNRDSRSSERNSRSNERNSQDRNSRSSERNSRSSERNSQDRDFRSRKTSSPILMRRNFRSNDEDSQDRNSRSSDEDSQARNSRSSDRNSQDRNSPRISVNSRLSKLR